MDEEHYERFGVNDMASGWPNSYLFELVTVAQMLMEKMGERYGVPFEPASGAKRGYHMPEMMDKAWRVNVTPAAGPLRGWTFTATYTWDMTGVWEGTTPFITDDYFEALRGGDLRDYTSAAVDTWLQDHPDLACVYRVAVIEAVRTEEQWDIPPDAPVEDLGKAFLSSVDLYVSPETPLDKTRFEAFGRDIKTALKARGLSPTVYSYQLTGSVADYKDGRFTLDSAEQAYRDGLYWDETTDAASGGKQEE